MRKIVVVLLIIVLAATAGAYVYFYQPFSKSQQAAMESVLPADTLGLIRICELKKQIDRFKAGRMGQALADLDLPRLMDVMSVPPETRIMFFEKLDNFKAALDSSWFDTLFGKDISLAVLNVPIDIEKLEDDDFQDVLDAFVVVAVPKAPARVLESLNSMFATELAVKTEAYQQWEIIQFPLENGQPVYYALSDGLMVAGLSAAPVKRCLDQSLDQASSLLQAPAYQQHCAGFYKPGQTDMVAYADADRLIKSFEAIVIGQIENNPEMAAIKTQLEAVYGLKSINFVQYDDGGPVVRSRMIIAVDQNRLSPYLAKNMGYAPMANPTLNKIPAKAMMYSWQNDIDLKFFWEQVQKQSAMTPEVVAQIRQAVAMNTGMELEALLEALGTQAGLLINDINMAGMFPVPELAFFFEVKQPEVIDRLLGHFFEQQMSQFNMPVQKEAHQGGEIQYMTFPMFANLSPAYVLSDGFCTLSSSHVLLKGMLDEPEANLGGDPDFTALGQGMTADNNRVFFMDTATIVAKTREVINWGMSWMAMAQPDEVEQARQVMELVVNPLLDGVSMIKAVGGRTINEKTHISSDFNMLMDRT